MKTPTRIRKGVMSTGYLLIKLIVVNFSERLRVFFLVYAIVPLLFHFGVYSDVLSNPITRTMMTI